MFNTSVAEEIIGKVHNKTMNLQDKTWKKFNLGELFSVKKGKRLIKDDMTEGNTPYISSINSNNGVSFYIDEEPRHNGNVITVNYNGSVGYAFYQDKPFFASDAVNILTAKGWQMTPEIGIFISTVITNERYRFSFGRSWKVERFIKSEIWLPVVEDGNPDFDWMHKYISSLPYGNILSNFS